MSPPPAPVAVIGMACRLPGDVTDSESLWRLLSERRNAWSPVPPERYNEAAFYHPNPEHKGATNHKGGHFISQNPGAFDATFFNISANEARAIDPQHRLALETTYEVFENGGITISSLRGSPTAVYAACFTHDYDRNIHKDINNVPKYQTTGTGEAILANRISYFFDLHGPSMTIDTGCSGSLVALHQACNSLRNGESQMAVALGVNLILSPDTMNSMSNLHMLSDQGRSFSFDARGAGYGRGEGVAAILVKRLDDAIAAGDAIHAIIRHSGVNQDGKTSGITQPNRYAQEALARRLYAEAGLDPQDTQYIEAHGTGTTIGDTLEVSGLANVFASSQRKHSLWVGSIKSNIGHTESTSGLAGVCKAIIALQRCLIPPNADFRSPRKNFKLDEWNIKIPTALQPWPEVKVRRASVNSFGYGGTNAHVIIEAPPSSSSQDTPILQSSSKSPRLITLSARSEVSLQSYTRSLTDWAGVRSVDSHVLPSLALTQSARRSIFEWRRSIVADSLEDLSRAPSIPAQQTTNTDVVFVFTGQGAQWATMGRELMSTSSSFARSIELSRQILQELGSGWDLAAELQLDDTMTRINESIIAQPASTALQIALVDMLRDLSIHPSMVIGHSSGEIAAAYCAGVLSHETALQVSFCRSQISSLVKDYVPSQGAMLAVGLGEAEVEPYLTGLRQGKVVVACVNSPISTTLSGDRTAIDEVSALLTAEGVFNRSLKVDTAYHSHHMQAVAQKYLESIGTLETKQPTVTFVSTVEAEIKISAFTAAYWAENLVSKVKFGDALGRYMSQRLETLLNDSSNRSGSRYAFIEIGPHSALAGPVRQTLKEVAPDLKYSYLSPLVRNRNAEVTLLELAGKLWEQGVDVELEVANSLHGKDKSAAVLSDLPTYRWNHSNIYWHESRLSRNYLYRKDPWHDLLGVRLPTSTDLEPTWTHFLDTESLPWLRDHVIDNLIIFPGAGYICMAVEALRQIVFNREPDKSLSGYEIKDISFMKALVVPQAPERIELQLRLRAHVGSACQTWHEFSVFALSTDDVWFEHCRGSIMAQTNFDTLDLAEEAWHSEALESKSSDGQPQVMASTEIYRQLTTNGNKYGSNFAILQELELTNSFAVGQVHVPDIKGIMPAQYQQSHILHPATLDGMMHTALPLYWQSNGESSVMPVSIKKMTISTLLPTDHGAKLLVAARTTPTGIRSADADLVVFNKDRSNSQRPLLKLQKIDIRGVGEPKKQGSADELPDVGYEMKWALDVDFLHLPDRAQDLSLLSSVKLDQRSLSSDSGYGGSRTSLTPENDSDQLQNSRTVKLLEYLKLLAFKHRYLSVLIAGHSSVVDSIISNTSSAFKAHRLDAIAISDEKYKLCKRSSGSLIGSLLTDIATASVNKYHLVVVTPELKHFVKQDIFLGGAKLIIALTGSDLTLPVTEDDVESQDWFCSKTELPILTETGSLIYSVTGGSDQNCGVSASEKSVEILPVRGMGSISDQLAVALMHCGLDTNTRTFGDDLTDVPSLRIVVDDGEHPILSNPTSEEFQVIRDIVTKSRSLLWLSVQRDVAGYLNPAKGLVKGFARTACAEIDDLNFVTLDVQDSFSSSLYTLSQIVVKIATDCISTSSGNDVETEYILRNHKVQIPRVTQDARLNSWIARSIGHTVIVRTPYSQSLLRPLKAEFKIGMPSKKVSFVHDTAAQDDLLPGHVQIEVLAHGLTAYDASIFLDPVPFNSSPPLGQCSGVVRAVGSDISQLASGDQVLVIGGAPLASCILTTPGYICRIPAGTSLHVAATISVPYMSAYRTLAEMASIGEQDHVLFFASSSDPVTRAGIAIAKYCRASVLVVVDSVEDANSLTNDLDLLPSELLISPSPASLASTTADCTGRRGFDVLFDTGNKMPPNLDLISPTGFYIGLDRVLSTMPVRLSSSITHIKFDLPTYAQTNPEKLPRLFQKALAVFCNQQSGRPVHPLIFSISQTAEALQAVRKLQNPVVLRVDAGAVVDLKTREAPFVELSSNATYLIVGGSGDIGQRICRILVTRGARNIVFISRRAMASEHIALLSNQLGGHLSASLRLESLVCDVSRISDVSGAAQQIQKLGLPAVKGLFQCSAGLQDCPVENMTSDAFRVPLATKQVGTCNLQTVFEPHEPDFFIMIASVSGVIGSRGQANYAAGNTFQDALAQNAIGSSTHYMALDLGIATGTSAIDGNNVRITNGLRQGLVPCDHATVAAFLEYAMSDEAKASNSRQAIIGFTSLSLQAAENSTPAMRGPIFNHVRLPIDKVADDGMEDVTKSLKEALTESPSQSEVIDLIQRSLISKLSKIVALDAGVIRDDVSLAEFGLDSLTAIELKNWIAKELEAAVQASEILDEANISTLARRVADRSALVPFNTESKQASQDMSNQSSTEDMAVTQSSRYIIPPRLPLWDLRASMQLYLDSVSSFLTDEQLERTQRLIRDFEGGKALELQERLRHRFEDPTMTAWDVFTSEFYLKERDPLRYTGTHYMCYQNSGNHSQAQVAAQIVLTALDFRYRLNSGKLEQTTIGGIPIDMNALYWLFDSHRKPQLGEDVQCKHGGFSHIVVLRRGHVFKVALPVLPGDLVYMRLVKTFEGIHEMSQSAVPPLAALTADHRDRWALNRESIIEASEINAHLVETVETAAFAVCLDDESPLSPTERCNQFMQGPPSNRWADKTVQFIVCENGKAGHVIDHTGCDGIAGMQLTAEIGSDLTKIAATEESDSSVSVYPLEHLESRADTAIQEKISGVLRIMHEAYLPATLQSFELSTLNGALFRSCKIPPRAAANICIQLAARMHFGVQHGTWEVIALATFFRGRIERAQSTQPAVYKFIEAASQASSAPGTSTTADLKTQLRNAATAYTVHLTRQSRGRGCMAHMRLLLAMLEEGEALPALFEDDSWKWFRNVHGRKLKVDISSGIEGIEGGFQMFSEDGVLVHYEIEDAKITFTIQSTGDRPQRFASCLERAAKFLRTLLE